MPSGPATAVEAPDARSTAPDGRVRIWQVALRWIAVLNAVLFALAAATRGKATSYGAAQLVCSGLFVAVCAFRSWFPVVYPTRLCLVDSRASSVLLTRTAATIAELSIATQLTLLLHALGDAAGSEAVASWSYTLIPVNVAAQLCCWYGISTRRSLGELFEESLWFLMVGIVFACFLRLASLVGGAPVVLLGLLGAGIYLLFQGTSVIPMYVRRSRDERLHPEHLGLAAGLREMASRCHPTGRWEDWGPEVAWMTLYFSLWTWLSIAMAVFDLASVA